MTRKITRGIARIIAGKEKKLYLGNLDAKRDWGFTPEYIEAMWLMMQQDQADDYVIGTGETRSVKEFLVEAFNYADLDLAGLNSHGEGKKTLKEKGIKWTKNKQAVG